MNDDEEQDCCPLCMEELDITDKTFDACPCGYQVCLWCWHQIKNEYNGLCPACRTPYAEISKQKNTLDREDVVRRTKQRKQKEKTERRNAAAAAAAQPTTRHAAVNRKSLANVRVMQRNLVYVIGLPQSFTDEERLRSAECFGQYGKIVKAVVNKTYLGTDRSNATASAYITFAHKEDALACIIAIDNFCLDGSVLRASFGTTKYCNCFLRNQVCNNPECLYLHELGDQDDSFTKEEMQSALHSGKAAFRESSMVSGSPEVRSGSEFPPAHRPQAAAPAAAGASADNADAQRKAQSAAAIYKLKQSAHRPDSTSHSTVSTAPTTTISEPFSKIVAGSSSSAARASTPEPTMAEKLVGGNSNTQSRGSDASQSSPAPAPSSEDTRKPKLHVDTSAARGGAGASASASAEETIVGPLEALKLATGSTIQEPAWAQPFPSPALALHAEPDDANPVGGFSPFSMGFDGGIHRRSGGGSAAAQEHDRPWNGGASGAFKDSHPHENDPLGSSSDSIFAPPPSGSSLSFASIDAIFSQRSDSSERLLGGQLSSNSTHSASSTPQAKNARSSRFAFANQPAGLAIPTSPAAPPHSGGLLGDGGGLSPSPFGRMEPQSRPASSPFGYGAAVSGLGNSNNVAPSFPMHQDTSAFPPLGSHHHHHHPRHAPPPPPPPSPFGSVGGFGNALQPSDDMMRPGGVGSGLAFLQQMLPNVNISYGGDFPSHSSGGFPQMSGSNDLAGSSGSQSGAWGSASLSSLGLNSNGDRGGDSGFYDPAIVSHSSSLQPAGDYFGLGGSLESDGEHRHHHHHHLLGGAMYRHSSSIMNNGN